MVMNDRNLLTSPINQPKAKTENPPKSKSWARGFIDS